MVPLSEGEKQGYARLTKKLVGNLVLIRKELFHRNTPKKANSNTKTHLIMALEKASFV
jgi:hypothetical protein